MCLVKTPKPVQQQTQAEAKKKLQVLRNRDLDGIDPMIRARALGSGSFRIDRGSGTRTPPTNTAPTARQSSLLNVLPLVLPHTAGAVAKIKRQAFQ